MVAGRWVLGGMDCGVWRGVLGGRGVGVETGGW